MTIWFSADTHYFHTNIIKYTNRPFRYYDEMNEALIANWNGCVRDDDHIYFLGDFSLGNPDCSKAIVCRLKGKKYWILGNHDHRPVVKKISQYFEWVKDVYLLTVQDRPQNQLIWLSHYAHFTWPHKDYGSWHLFGHSHGMLRTLSNSFGMKALDVGVDCWDYQPVSYELIKEKMATIKEEKY